METQTSGHIAFINKPSLIVVLFSLCFTFWFVDFWRPINEDLFYSHPEVYQRYAYLPATFLNNGSFEWATETITKHKINNGLNSIYNYGSALMYSPFFFAALFYSKITEAPIEQGFSVVFQNAIHWSGIVYMMLALILLRRVIRVYFNEQITAITLFALFFGTSMFYYTYVLSELPESQLLFLTALFLFIVSKINHKQDSKFSIVLGFIFGIISLIRYFDVYILFILIFYSNHHSKENKTTLHFFSVKNTLLFLTPVLIVWMPQLLFNHLQYASIDNPQINFNQYNFTDSRIDEVLIGFKKGWLTFSPIMIFSLIGLFFVGKNLPFSKTILTAMLVLIVFVYGASWDWRNADYFSARKLCTAIVWLSFPFAAFVNWLFYSSRSFLITAIIKLLFYVFVFSSFCLIASQSYLFITRTLDPANMDSVMFWEIFRKFKY